MLLELPRRLLSSSSRLYGRARGQCVLLCTPGFIFLCKRYVSSRLHLLHMRVCACVVLLSRLPADAAGCESSRTEGRPLRWSQSGKNSIFSRVFEARGWKSLLSLPLTHSLSLSLSWSLWWTTQWPATSLIKASACFFYLFIYFIPQMKHYWPDGSVSGYRWYEWRWTESGLSA